MIKKSILSMAVFALTALAANTSFGFCGGTPVYNNDCASNPRGYAVSCCPRGYRVQGVAYNDHAGSDYVDAVSAVCRHVVKGNDMMPTDFQRPPVVFMCNKTEVMAGIAQKDMPKKGGKNSDVLDGVTAICQTPGSKSLRMVYNRDLAGNGRSYVRTVTYLPNRIVGIAYKDISKNNVLTRGNSDRADCATVSYRHCPKITDCN